MRRLMAGRLLGMVAEQKLLTEVFSVHVHDLAGDLDEVGLAYEPLVRSQEDRFARAMVAGFEIEEVDPATHKVTAGPTVLPAADASLSPR